MQRALVYRGKHERIRFSGYRDIQRQFQCIQGVTASHNACLSSNKWSGARAAKNVQQRDLIKSQIVQRIDQLIFEAAAGHTHPFFNFVFVSDQQDISCASNGLLGDELGDQFWTNPSRVAQHHCYAGSHTVLLLTRAAISALPGSTPVHHLYDARCSLTGVTTVITSDKRRAPLNMCASAAFRAAKGSPL